MQPITSASRCRFYYQDYRVLVDANLAVVRDFDVDIVQAISDPFREAHDFGAVIEFPDDDLPICRRPLLADPDDLKHAQAAQPRHRQAHERPLGGDQAALRDEVGGETPIMGWVEGALAEAADLRGVSDLLMDLAEAPEWAEELLEICVEVAIAFARAQIEAGADIIGLGDAVASLISPAMYRSFALPYEQRIFAAVHQMGPGLARLQHVRQYHPA